MINSEAATVYLGLGTNLGDREGNLKQAVNFLSQRLRLGGVSSVYESDPEGGADQPRYLNQVIEVFTRLAPKDLLVLAKNIEIKLGRIGGTGEPRTIDIDILLFSDQTINTPDLVIPHQKMAERAFVLVPLAEIAPGAVHPVLKKTAGDLLEKVKGVSGVSKLKTGAA